MVLDLLMPQMDGADLLSVIRSYARFRTIPVVVWTGAGDTAVVDRARRHEVAEVIMKGKANYNELLAAISRVLGSVQSDEVHRMKPK
jgi:DNA-binding NarL/FixJ family response regulator